MIRDAQIQCVGVVRATFTVANPHLDCILRTLGISAHRRASILRLYQNVEKVTAFLPMGEFVGLLLSDFKDRHSHCCTPVLDFLPAPLQGDFFMQHFVFCTKDASTQFNANNSFIPDGHPKCLHPPDRIGRRLSPSDCPAALEPLPSADEAHQRACSEPQCCSSPPQSFLSLYPRRICCSKSNFWLKMSLAKLLIRKALQARCFAQRVRGELLVAQNTV